MSQLPDHLIAIHSAPRSGSSWLGQIFKSSRQVEFRYQPLFSYAFKDFLNPSSSRERIIEFTKAIRASDDDYIHQRIEDVYVEYPDHGARKDVTHLIWKEVRYHHIIRNLMAKMPELRMIGLVRHPCAVIDSWIRSPREFKAGWEVSLEWRNAPSKNQNRPEEFNGFAKWLEVAKLFQEIEALYPNRFLIVRYSDLNASPVKVVKGIFTFCGLSFARETEDFIVQSRSKEGADANSIYRLVRPDVGWKQRLPSEITTAIVEETRASGLERFLVE